MFTVRNAVAASLIVTAIALLASIVSLAGPPDSDGKGTDSYGTYWHGFRAAYEMLDELGAPVDRRLGPPGVDLPTPTTLVIAAPDAELIGYEPTYLQNLAAWVERGGRIVVTTDAPPQSPPKSIRPDAKPLIDVLAALGLSDVKLTGRALAIRGDNQGDEARSGQSNDRTADRLRRDVQDSITGILTPKSIPFERVAVAYVGSNTKFAGQVTGLQMPKTSTSRIEFDPSRAECTVVLKTRGGKPADERVLAAAFRRGRGEIVVVAEPSLLMNTALAQADNAVFAYDLLTAGGTRGVVFDEFYHGLSVRGNALWLLTQVRYALPMLAGLVLICAIVRRKAVLLGPPLEAPVKSRRTVLEYVDAMSRFFCRTKSSPPFLLHEVRDGTLRTLAERYGLQHSDRTPEKLAEAIERRSPAEAARFRAALAAADAAARRGRRLPEVEALRAIQGLSRCL